MAGTTALIAGGSLLAGGIAQDRASKRAANAARDAAKFKPINVQGGLGSATFGSNGLTTSLDPRLQTLQSQFLQQAGGGLNPSQQLVSDAFTQSGQTLFGGANQAFSGGMNQLLAAQNMDPNQIAQNQFGLQQALINPQRQQDFFGLENRLLNQGQLGLSIGNQGNPALNAFFQANRMQDLASAQSALGQGLFAQNQLFNQGLGGAGFGSQLFGQGAGLFEGANNLNQQAIANQFGFLNQAQALENLPLQYAQLGANIGTGNQAAGANIAPTLANSINQRGQLQASLFNNVGQGLLNTSPTSAKPTSGFDTPGAKAEFFDPNNAL